MNASFEGMENGTSAWPNAPQNISLETVVAGFRRLKVEELYGEHFHALCVATLVISVLGYVTNALNVVVLGRTPLANSMNLFLMVLSVSDVLLITTNFSHVVHYLDGFRLYPHFDFVVFYVANTYFETSFTFVSNWLVAVVGIWRLLVVTWPLQSRRWCSKFRAKLTIVLIFVFSFSLSSLIFAQFTYLCQEFFGMKFYETQFTEFSKAHGKLFLKIQWGVQLLKNLVPVIVMFGATVGLLVVLFWVRYQRQRVLKIETSAAASHRLTLMLLVLLVLYWLSNLPDAFLFLIGIVSEGDEEALERYRKSTDIIRVFSLGHTSVSFLLYYAMGKDFRKKFHDLFCSRAREPSQSKSTAGQSETSTLPSSEGEIRTQQTVNL